jgi:hypothetical protein
MSIKPSSIVATGIAVLIGFYFVGEINKYNENANRPSSYKEAADAAERREKRSRGIAEDPTEEDRRLTAIAREARKAKFNPQRSFFDIAQDMVSSEDDTYAERMFRKELADVNKMQSNNEKYLSRPIDGEPAK